MKVNVGIIGLGWMGQLHAKYLQKVENCRVAAVCDKNRETLEVVSRQYNADAYEDYTALLERKDIDTVYVVTPQKYHYQIVKDCIDAKKHILCEKPLGLTPEEINDMREMVKKSDRKFIVDFPERFVVSSQEAKDEILNGAVGKIQFIRGNFRFSMKEHHLTHGAWVFDKSVGGGLILESSVHLWDAVRFFTDSEVESVMAVAHNHETANFEDNFASIAYLSNGGIACIDMSGWLPKGAATDKRFEIIGNDGCIYLDEFRNFMTIHSENGVENNPGMVVHGMTHKDLMWHSSIEGGVKRLEQYFIDCILKDKDPSPSVEDGARACEITWSVVKSLESGKLEKVHYGK